jgi:hypothetical protein
MSAVKWAAIAEPYPGGVRFQTDFKLTDDRTLRRVHGSLGFAESDFKNLGLKPRLLVGSISQTTPSLCN